MKKNVYIRNRTIVRWIQVSRVRKKLLTLLGLSLTKSSNFFDSDVLLHSSDVPIFTFTAEDEDLGTSRGNSPVKKVNMFQF